MNESVSRVAVGDLSVEIWPNAEDIGREAARRLKEALIRAVELRGSARFIAATGNSQFPLISALGDHDIPWDKVDVFHMDEYLGLDQTASASFRRWIRERIQDRFAPRSVDYIRGDAPDVDAEIARYEAALRSAPVDVVCMGIGENGHLAFNEPNACDFNDNRWVAQIELTPESRRQQVDEGHFADISAVPSSAISLTIPALLSAETIIVSAPEARKALAVRDALGGPISTACPASILREVPNAVLLLDRDSSAHFVNGVAADS